jgi:uncharacterized protein with NAD-binding domain and iron-sulfur cluster
MLLHHYFFFASPLVLVSVISSITQTANGFSLPTSVILSKSLKVPVRVHVGLVPTKRRTQLYFSQNGDAEPPEKAKKAKDTLDIVIVGGGWAGYSAAESLSHNIARHDKHDVSITLVDASKSGGGLAGGFKTKTGRSVEAGIHGFWREYKNTFSMMDRIEDVGSNSDVLGDYTPSILFSKNGRVALAPVLGGNDEGEDDNSDTNTPLPQRLLQEVLTSNLSPSSLSSSLNKLLPPPLDIALLAEFNPSSPLSTADRLSAFGLLGPWIDFQQESPTSWAIYDKFSARTLFQEKAGLTTTLYEELIEPLLSVLPMCPDYDCSAAAVLSCFHVFALQSKGAFDVKWCRGSIREKIFDPWYQQLKSRGVDIRNDTKVLSIVSGDSNDKKYCIRVKEGNTNDEGEMIKCDAIVMAVGGTAMSIITNNSPALQTLNAVKERDNFQKLRGVTCVAVRLFLKPHEITTSGLNGGEYDKTQLPPNLAKAMTDSPIAVCGPDPAIGTNGILNETGFCIYDLQRMHDEFSVDENKSDELNQQVAVLEVDYYRADMIANMSDDEIAKLALETVTGTFNVEMIDESSIVDFAVVRARNAVSHFAPLSASYSPGVKLDNGLYMSGDWIDRSGHASWSTEKAVVTGIQSATALSKDLCLEHTFSNIIPVPHDTFELERLREVAQILRQVIPPKDGGIPQSPWSILLNKK